MFALGVDGFDGVPDADHAGGVARGDVEPRGGEARHGCRGGVAGVLLGFPGAVDCAEEDGFAGLVLRREESVTIAVNSGVGEGARGGEERRGNGLQGETYWICYPLALGIAGELGWLAPSGDGGCRQDLLNLDRHVCLFVCFVQGRVERPSEVLLANEQAGSVLLVRGQKLLESVHQAAR